jgi:ABC-2 type transport system ATP-binding protein
MRKRTALIGLNLKVERGEIFGYLGPNGAGKTTTIKILMNLISPTAGEVKILGQDVKNPEVRRKIGFLPDRPYFYEYLTGREFLDYCGKLFNLKKRERTERIDKLLELVGLTQDQNLQLRKYSQGMLQRLGFAQVLINDPELLILDEPLTSLDPLGRRDFKDILIKMKNQGKTVFFSSHILEDAEDICDRVGILVKGKLIKVGILEEFIKSEIEHIDIIVSAKNEYVIQKLKNAQFNVEKKGNYFLIRVSNSEDVYQTIQEIYGAGGKVISVNPIRQKLENIFLREISKVQNNNKVV